MFHADCLLMGETNCQLISAKLHQESPRQTKPKKGPKRKVHEFCLFCEFWCFSLGKQARFTLNFFFSGMPPRKVHELAFFWFGLPGPLLITFGRPLKTTFDMITLIFGSGGCPSCPFYPLKRVPRTPFWLKTLPVKAPLKTT